MIPWQIRGAIIVIAIVILIANILPVSVLYGAKRRRQNELSRGNNQFMFVMRNGKRQVDTLHAEIDAMNKLPHNSSKRLIQVNMYVIRLGNHGKLANSKPCQNCVTLLANGLTQKGYKLRYVNYSDEQGEISTIAFNRLVATKATLYLSSANRARRRGIEPFTNMKVM